MPAKKIQNDRLDYETSTPKMVLDPKKIVIQSTSTGVVRFYQPRISKAVWRPAFGRKLGFLVTYENYLLGVIFLATPVIRLSVRDAYLFPDEFKAQHPELQTYRSGVKGGKLEEKKIFDYGRATRGYMDMSVCVATQPIGWYWNIGKLLAMLAPTLGDYIESAYPSDKFLGVTTTSWWGAKAATQYTRVYKLLGHTEGFGSVMVSDEKMKELVERARKRCPNCTPGCLDPLPLIEKPQVVDSRVRKDLPPLDRSEWCVLPYSRWGDGANPRMRRIAALWKYFPEEKPKEGFKHGQLRGVYYHPAVPAEMRPEIIQQWYKRWGLPRYEKKKNEPAPYQNGMEGRHANDRNPTR